MSITEGALVTIKDLGRKDAIYEVIDFKDGMAKVRDLSDPRVEFTLLEGQLELIVEDDILW